MAGTENTLTLRGPRPGARAPLVASDSLYVLITEAPAAPAAERRLKRPARRRAEVDEQEIGTMRDLVLGAFLGPQFFHEDDGSYVAPYTTEGTRDMLPHGLTEADLKTRDAAAIKRVVTRVHASETRPKKKGQIPLGPLAFQDAHIAREVARLATEQGQWLRYAYGDSKQWEDEAGTVAALWARAEPLLGKLQAKTLARVRSLAHLAVQSGKARKNSGKEVHAPARLAVLLGVSDVNWRQHWAPRWQLLAEQLDKLDRDALAALAERMAGYEFVLIDRGI